MYFTFANNDARVSKTADLTPALNLSPSTRIRGPVICTTVGFKDSADVKLMTSPRPIAADSFSSGAPFNTASLKIGNIGAIP